MNSRSMWLNRTRDYLKQDLKGKKYFRIHKNLDNFDAINDSPSGINKSAGRLLEKIEDLREKSARIEKPKERPLHLTPDLGKIIFQKDTQIESLRKLYYEARDRIKNLEQSKKHEEKSLILNSRTPKKLFLNEGPTSLPIYKDINITGRNKSTQNSQAGRVVDFSLLNQKRFTKNNPKIVLGNPITGIPINYK